MPEKVTHILIAENVPSLNKGEMTILDGMLESFKILGQTDIVMFSEVPDIDRPRYEPRVKILDIRRCSSLNKLKSLRPITKLVSSLAFFLEHVFFVFLYKILGRKALKIMRSKLWEQYANCDVIIIGHDNTFGVLVGTAYFYYIYLPLFAKGLGKPIMFYGGSILKEQRPLWFWKLALKLSLKYMDLVTLRERITYERLRKHNLLSNKVIVTGDPAFLLPPAPETQIAKIMEQEGLSTDDKPLIGMTITHSTASKAFSHLTGSASYNQHIATIAEVVDHMVVKYGATIIFVPHCIGPESNVDDRIVSKAIFNKSCHQSRIKIITREYAASELKGLIGQLNMFLGERIHSTINALSMGVPSVILVNKNDQRHDIIDMLGQKEAICYVNNLDTGTLIQTIDFLWSRAELIRQDLHTQVPAIQEKSMSNGRLLQQLLGS